MALSAGEQNLLDLARSRGQTTVSSSFVPSESLAKVNAEIARRQESANAWVAANPNATPDQIAQVAIETGITAHEIARATGATDVATIQAGLDNYTNTGSTGQIADTYTGGSSQSNSVVLDTSGSNNTNQSSSQSSNNQSSSQSSNNQESSPPSQEAISKLADLYYLSMSGGVSSGLLRNAVRDAGGDPNDPFAANKILSDAGYTPGNTMEFYSSAGAEPVDPQAKAALEGRQTGATSLGNNNLEQIAYLRSQGFDRDISKYDADSQAFIAEKEQEYLSEITPTTLEDLLGTFSDEEMQRYNELNQFYNDMFGRNVAFTGAEYWIRGGGANAPINETTLANAALGADLDYYTTNVLNPLQFQELVGSLSTSEQQRYNELNLLYNRLFGRDIGLEGLQYWIRGDGSSAQITEETLINAAQGDDLEYYNEFVRVDDTEDTDGTDGGGSPREATSGNIVPGVPQVGEVNVMDYMGLQAGDPTLPTGTKLATQLKKLDDEAEGTKLGDISTTDKTKLDTETDAILSSDIKKVGSTVEGTYTVPGQVTIPSSEGVVTDIITEKEFTEAGVPSQFVDPVTGKLKTDENLATMTAEKSYTDINKEATAFTEAKQELAEVDPLATVTGQLAILQEQFADGEIPVWASGAFREVNALMAQRGIGGSTMAAEAITNALMQSAIPIAQQDASFYQNVTLQNLSNEQQAEMAKFNARTSAIFNDQAAENAAKNLNTQSENELTQFFANLATQVSTSNAQMSNSMEQFNATAENQMTQFFEELGLTAETFNADAINELATFDAEQTNIIAQFNASLENQREQFNVQNQLAIDASNVQWRRDVNTANTSATNAALQFDAQNLLGIQQTALNNIWQHYDTILNYTYQAEQNEIDRAYQLMLTTMSQEFQRSVQEDSDLMDLFGDGIKSAAMIASSQSGRDFIASINPFSSDDG